MKHKILLVLLLSSMACITATAQKVSMDFRQVKHSFIVTKIRSL